MARLSKEPHIAEPNHSNPLSSQIDVGHCIYCTCMQEDIIIHINKQSII